MSEIEKLTVASDRQIGVDRAGNRINGFVVAEVGDFKDRRGHFSEDSLKQIVSLGNAAVDGLPSRLNHSTDVNMHVGRVRNFTLDEDGKKVRADLHFARTSTKPPVGGGTPIAEFLMDLAEEDPGAISSSLILKPERRRRDGLPDLWTPKDLIASDIVSAGNAVHGKLLNVSEYPKDEVLTLETEVKERFEAVEKASEKLAALLTSQTEQLSKLVETISEERTARKAEQLAAKRTKDIVALCDMSRSVVEEGEQSKWIHEESLSVDGVREIIHRRMAEKLKPMADDTEEKLTADVDRKYRDEYEAARSTHEKLGIDIDTYVNDRRLEDGLPVNDTTAA